VLWGLLAAIETLFLIPVFLVTFFLQNHLLRGVTFGTVKALTCRQSKSGKSPRNMARFTAVRDADLSGEGG
jgi:hypothetical protein